MIWPDDALLLILTRICMGFITDRASKDMNIRDMSPEARRAFASKGGKAASHTACQSQEAYQRHGRLGGLRAASNGKQRESQGLPYSKSTICVVCNIRLSLCPHGGNNGR